MPPSQCLMRTKGEDAHQALDGQPAIESVFLSINSFCYWYRDFHFCVSQMPLGGMDQVASNSKAPWFSNTRARPLQRLSALGSHQALLPVLSAPRMLVVLLSCKGRVCVSAVSSDTLEVLHLILKLDFSLFKSHSELAQFHLLIQKGERF